MTYWLRAACCEHSAVQEEDEECKGEECNSSLSINFASDEGASLPLMSASKKEKCLKTVLWGSNGAKNHERCFCKLLTRKTEPLGRQMGHSVGDSNIPNIVTCADLTFVSVNLLKYSSELIFLCLNQCPTHCYWMVKGSIYVHDGY